MIYEPSSSQTGSFPSPIPCLGICWSPKNMCFIGVTYTASYHILKSSDGINWASQTSGVANINFSSVAWSPILGLFAAVAQTGTGNRVHTSPDGVTWTARTTTGFDYTWNKVIWSNILQKFIAVASSGETNPLLTSADGITWAASAIGQTGSWQDIAESSNMLMAVDSTNLCYTSTDGVTWASRSTLPSSNNWRIIWIAELGIWYAYIFNLAMSNTAYSQNGITWYAPTNYPNGAACALVAWLPNQSTFVALPYGGNAPGYTISPDSTYKAQPIVNTPALVPAPASSNNSMQLQRPIVSGAAGQSISLNNTRTDSSLASSAALYLGPVGTLAGITGAAGSYGNTVLLANNVSFNPATQARTVVAGGAAAIQLSQGITGGYQRVSFQYMNYGAAGATGAVTTPYVFDDTKATFNLPIAGGVGSASAPTAWNVSTNEYYYMTAQATGAISVAITGIQAGITNTFVFWQGASAQTLTFTASGVTFNQTNTSTVNATGTVTAATISTVNQYYTIKLDWVTTTLCFYHVD